MKNIVKTIKTLELIWPIWASAVAVCRTLDRLEEGLVPYWEPYWNGKRDEIGIRFASEEGVIDAFPGSVITIEDEYATRMRKPISNENDLTTTIGERKRAVAYVYDPANLKDLRALSESGHRVELNETGTFVHDRDDEHLVSGGWIIEDADTRKITVEHGAVSLEDIADCFGNSIVSKKG